MGRERRSHVRKRVVIGATLVDAEAHACPAVVRDLSLGGAFVEVSPVPSFGTRVTLRFELGGHPISLEATVRWTRPEGVGVHFGLLGALETYVLTESLAGVTPAPEGSAPDER